MATTEPEGRKPENPEKKLSAGSGREPTINSTGHLWHRAGIERGYCKH